MDFFKKTFSIKFLSKNESKTKEPRNHAVLSYSKMYNTETESFIYSFSVLLLMFFFLTI